ncbi:hypothetical protein ACFQH8_11645 [Halomicroarcula sp. GCM10025710]
MTDRGQSATVGFVVIFSMVLLMVALISVSGFATLDHVQDAERVNNGVRSFEILSDNVDDVVGDEVPSRTTTVSSTTRSSRRPRRRLSRSPSRPTTSPTGSRLHQSSSMPAPGRRSSTRTARSSGRTPTGR